MLNHMEILHGGELFKHCDSTIGLLASEYAQSRVMTVGAKSFNFKKKAYVGQQVCFCTTLIATSQHTMTFYTRITAKDFDESESIVIGDGVLIFIAVDRNLQPKIVPKLTVLNLEERDFIEQRKQDFQIE